MSTPTLLAVPNFSEGRRPELVAELGAALETAAWLLDVHADPDHDRSVFTATAPPRRLAEAVLAGARVAVKRLDITRYTGAHPAVGVLDVAPIVYLDDAALGAACAEALVLADLLAEELRLPVFLYGALAEGRSRAELRRGGPEALARRIYDGALSPDFGPHRLHPSAGAALVSARPPLVAFNVELAPPATIDDARRIAAAIREGGPEGLRSVRAIGAWLAHRGVAQVSMNVEDLVHTTLPEVVAAVARHARVLRAELVGLAPAQALDGFPEDVELTGRASIEDVLARHRPVTQARAANLRG